MGVSVVPPSLEADTLMYPRISCWLLTAEQPIEPYRKSEMVLFRFHDTPPLADEYSVHTPPFSSTA